MTHKEAFDIISKLDQQTLEAISTIVKNFDHDYQWDISYNDISCTLRTLASYIRNIHQSKEQKKTSLRI